jgi:hypothetical protein
VDNAVKKSGTPLYWGSEGTRTGFFFGDIKELKIKNGGLDENEITANWARMKMLP